MSASTTKTLDPKPSTPPSTPPWAVEPSSRPGHARIRAQIGGLHCSLCTGTIEKALGRREGVAQVAVSLTHEQALIDYDPKLVDPDELLSTLRAIGYDIRDPRKVRPFEEEEAELVHEARRLLVATAASLVAIALISAVPTIWAALVPLTVVATLVPIGYVILRGQGQRTAVLGTAALALPGLAAMGLRAAGVGAAVAPWITAALAVAVVFGVAPHILSMAFQSARRGILNQHVMLEIGAFAGITGGVIGAVSGGDAFPVAPFFAVSVLVVNYHIFSEWLSLLVKTRSSQAVKRLMDLQPDTARIVEDSGERELPIQEVALGMRVRIRPGERIPVDGQVVGGHSAVDESLVSGEPIAVEKSEGNEVVGGSMNGSGTLLVEVTAVGADSFLAQVVRHVEDARALKPGILHLVDRVLRVYTPTVLIIAAVALVGWLGGSWLLTGTADVQRGVFAALSVLVMGYPCAVGIAAPLAIVRGAGDAADRGIIMRTGEAFQSFGGVTHLVLDKTGTLTHGRPSVRVLEADADEDELLSIAAAAESSSEHPLAQAIVTAAFDRGVTIAEAEDFSSISGLGVVAAVNGKQVRVGRPAFVEDGGIALGDRAERITQLEGDGHTVVAVAYDHKLLGIIALGDELRPDAADTVNGARAAGLIPVLLTGDNPRAAAVVAAQLGIDEVHAGVLPDGKAQVVRDLQRTGRVAMVGDGINDAPALMQADVGVAMGGSMGGSRGKGTDIAVDAADVVIIGDRVGAVLQAREISKRSYRRTRQNVGLAFAFNGIGIPLAATGLIYPVWAMVAMAASVTTIFINSLGGRPELLFAAIGGVGQDGNQDGDNQDGGAATDD